jgi:hypothetical protein
VCGFYRRRLAKSRRNDSERNACGICITGVLMNFNPRWNRRLGAYGGESLRARETSVSACPGDIGSRIIGNVNITRIQ